MNTNMKWLNKIWPRKKRRLASYWTESDLFRNRFIQLEEEWKNFCMITWKYLTRDMVKASSFPHFLNKNVYWEFRYCYNNVWLVAWIEEHKEVDRRIALMKRDIWTVEIEQMIRDWYEIYPLLQNYK